MAQVHTYPFVIQTTETVSVENINIIFYILICSIYCKYILQRTTKSGDSDSKNRILKNNKSSSWKRDGKTLGLVYFHSLIF